jgi:hypothetical protein
MSTWARLSQTETNCSRARKEEWQKIREKAALKNNIKVKPQKARKTTMAFFDRMSKAETFASVRFYSFIL